MKQNGQAQHLHTFVFLHVNMRWARPYFCSSTHAPGIFLAD
jgi:hypothetical protein